MTNKQFNFCYAEIANYTDRQAYVSDLVFSSIWEDSDTGDIQAARIKAVENLWDAYHKTVKEISADAGMSNRKLAERFSIPYRTMENWCSEKNSCPAYVRLMMQEILGQFSRG